MEWRSEGNCACAKADGDHKSQPVVTVHFNMDFVVGIFVIVKISSYRFASAKGLMAQKLNIMEYVFCTALI